MVLSQTQRESQLLALTPTERYAAFVLEHGALSARIPLHHVASYLGITNVSLSRKWWMCCSCLHFWLAKPIWWWRWRKRDA